ncbi:hypothetical protein H5410_056459 [Solanum commersonii]|uniref:Uncharacterized protein n=1 Tax=Solanum commersonii TaxID=4109 RepID=A0A9J5WLS2_SOLCO|nr:hypothetical protein H5410_056459 [Solanum commersonii]
MTGRIENCTESLQVIINKWYTASNKVVESITPPLEGINIPIAGTVIKSSPFKEKSDKTPKTVSTLQKEPVSILQEKSTLLQKLASSRFHNMKNYHNKPSFPDLQYEENAFLSTSSHEGRSITE